MQTIPTELIVKKEHVGNYPYTLSTASGEVVGYLALIALGVYRVIMIDDTYQQEQYRISAKDLESR